MSLLLSRSYVYAHDANMQFIRFAMHLNRIEATFKFISKRIAYLDDMISFTIVYTMEKQQLAKYLLSNYYGLKVENS